MFIGGKITAQTLQLVVHNFSLIVLHIMCVACANATIDSHSGPGDYEGSNNCL